LTFKELLQKLFKVLKTRKKEQKDIEKGLKIAKLFRNKEGHAVSVFHDCNPDNYREFESSLVLLYQKALHETLSIYSAFGKGEKGEFAI